MCFYLVKWLVPSDTAGFISRFQTRQAGAVLKVWGSFLSVVPWGLTWHFHVILVPVCSGLSCDEERLVDCAVVCHKGLLEAKNRHSYKAVFSLQHIPALDHCLPPWPQTLELLADQLAGRAASCPCSWCWGKGVCSPLIVFLNAVCKACVYINSIWSTTIFLKVVFLVFYTKFEMSHWGALGFLCSNTFLCNWLFLPFTIVFSILPVKISVLHKQQAMGFRPTAEQGVSPNVVFQIFFYFKISSCFVKLHPLQL